MAGVFFTVLLLLAWLGCFYLGREAAARKRVDPDWRLSWVLACLGFGFLVTIIVETSSLMRSLNRPTLALLWSVADVFLFLTVLKLRSNGRRISLATNDGSSSGAHSQGSGAWTQVRRWPADVKWLFGLSAVFCAFLFLVALLTPTTNIDSLGYHLGRMAHWIQQGSVDHFPTDDLRQIEFGPWSSYLMTNLFLLWGNDRLLNLVQWFAMLSSLVVLTWVAEQLGALPKNCTSEQRLRTNAFTCLFAVTLPIGLVESISTQNDYTTSLWVLCLFAIALLVIKEPGNCWYVGGAAFACGLGVLTKATAYIYAAPLIVAGSIWWLCRAPSGSERSDWAEAGTVWKGARLRLQAVFLFSGIFFVLNAPHMARNYALFGSPLGSGHMLSLEKNEQISAAVAASNLVRNLALHTTTGIPWLTDKINLVLEALHGLTGKDLNDPATTFKHAHFNFSNAFVVWDSYASCTVHLLLCLVAATVLIVRRHGNGRLITYVGVILSSALLFCATLKWQLWHPRLHLPWFILMAPVVSIMLARHFSTWPMRFNSVALVIFAMFTLGQNTSRPVFSAKFWSRPREQQYFTPFREGTPEAVVRLADTIIASRCENIGLKAQFTSIEFPIWNMLRKRGFAGRMRRSHVENISASLGSHTPKPDVIISQFDVKLEAVTYAYPHVQKFGAWTVLWTKQPIEPTAATFGTNTLARVRSPAH
jgi:hypothetical protein